MYRLFSTTLAFYLGRKFFTTVFLSTMVLTLFIFLMDFIELTRRLANRPDIENDTALALVMLKMPDLLLQVAPFAILIGTMICFTRLSKDQELIAIRATGMPARQFLIPPLLVCILIGVFNLCVFNSFASAMLKSHQRLTNEIFPGSTQGLVINGGRIWLKQNEEDKEYLIYAKAVKQSGRLLENTTVFRFSKEGEFTERVDAKYMVLRNKIWELDNATILRPGEKAERRMLMVLPTKLTPDMIRNSFTSPHTLSVWELHKFVKLLKENGFPVQQHEMYLQQLLAGPALLIAMFLVGAPFALHFSCSSGMTIMILSGLGFGFSFYYFSNFISAYGLAGRLNLTMAAWAPTAIAALIGLALFLHFREE